VIWGQLGIGMLLACVDLSQLVAKNRTISFCFEVREMPHQTTQGESQQQRYFHAVDLQSRQDLTFSAMCIHTAPELLLPCCNRKHVAPALLSITSARLHNPTWQGSLLEKRCEVRAARGVLIASGCKELFGAALGLCKPSTTCRHVALPQAIAAQLMDTDDVELDFDQIQAKRPSCRDSVLPWFQERVSSNPCS